MVYPRSRLPKGENTGSHAVVLVTRQVCYLPITGNPVLNCNVESDIGDRLVHGLSLIRRTYEMPHLTEVIGPRCQGNFPQLTHSTDRFDTPRASC